MATVVITHGLPSRLLLEKVMPDDGGEFYVLKILYVCETIIAKEVYDALLPLAEWYHEDVQTDEEEGEE